MPSLQDIRRRIRSVKNTQQVTKAMKMISAVKLRKAQERLLALRPFASRLHELVENVVCHFDQGCITPKNVLAQAFLVHREEKRIRVVVVAGDKGLCGGFNANILRFADNFLMEREGQLAHLDVIGKRAIDWARKSKLPVHREYSQLTLADFRTAAGEIAESAAAQYENGEIDALYFLHNYFFSAVNQAPNEIKIFPLVFQSEDSCAHEVSPLLEPDPETVLASLLPKYVELEVLRSLLESSTSEHAARMSSMDKASTNAQEMIDSLTLKMNKARQTAITNQIIEIVSGAAS